MLNELFTKKVILHIVSGLDFSFLDRSGGLGKKWAVPSGEEYTWLGGFFPGGDSAGSGYGQGNEEYNPS